MKKTKEKIENDNKKCEILKNKKFIIALTIAIILIIAIIIVAMSMKKSNNNEKVEFTGESNGIEYSANIGENSDVFVVMKNETGKTVSKLELIVTYYDGEGKELAQKTSTTNVYLKNNEISLNKVNSGIVNIDKIDNYKIEIIPENYTGEDKLSNYEKMEISEVQDKDAKVSVNVKNKTDKVISEAYLYAVFYKDGLPMQFIGNDLYNLDNEKEIEFNKPVDENGNNIKYDFCKIYIKY